jgi:hypothetical protein
MKALTHPLPSAICFYSTLHVSVTIERTKGGISSTIETEIALQRLRDFVLRE